MNDDKDKTAISEAEYQTLAAETAARAAEEGPGPVPVDPDVADYMGAFEEDALSEEDALDSAFDDVPSLDALWDGETAND